MWSGRWFAPTAVVPNQQLVAEHRRQDLRLIVVRPTMPCMLVQLEEALEPVVERFNCLAATATVRASAIASL